MESRPEVGGRLAPGHITNDTAVMLNPKGAVCPRCAREVPVWAMATCPMCTTSVCHRCAHQSYGRLFCSQRCGDHFFHGEAEDDEDDEREG